jgi:hypothetical protein
MTWKVFRLIDEEDDRTSSDEIEGFINEQAEEGWSLAAASDGFLFFAKAPSDGEYMTYDAFRAKHLGMTPKEPMPQGGPLSPPVYDANVDDVPDEEPEPAPVQTPTTRGRKKRAAAPDPSIRPTGQTEPAVYADQPNAVQVDPKLLQGMGPAQPSPGATADPFGLGG